MDNLEILADEKRLNRQDALNMLLNYNPIQLGELADKFRRSKHANKTYYAVNAAISYSNICEALCPICSFAKKENQEGGYILSPEDIYEKTLAFSKKGAEEIHIIGGMYSKLPFEYYVDVVKAVKAADKNINLVAFTVSECVLMSRVSGIPLGDVINILMAAGVDALPGGGAEIFEDSVREKISPNKLSADEWISAMNVAHKCKLKTNATMLYGHIEKPEHVIDHLFRLRDSQDLTGGFKAFVPLPFRRGKSIITSKSSGTYDLKICAISRLILDNFDHIRIPLPHFGDRLAQILLNFGADDIGGTHWSEEVATSAGAATAERTEIGMQKIISNAGFEPVKVNSNYAI